MKLNYDNEKDAHDKLVGTYCMFGGKAFTVKGLWAKSEKEPTKFIVNGIYMVSGKTLEMIEIDDPKFNCSDYNIGYVNRSIAASWFYRLPAKQFQQGLRYTQVQSRCSSPAYRGVDFKAGKAVGAMLENSYPKFRSAAELLREREVTIIAFHRNFAMSYDSIHGDFIVEYKGEQIGFTHNLEDFKLMTEHQHLIEALKEATQ